MKMKPGDFSRKSVNFLPNCMVSVSEGSILHG